MTISPPRVVIGSCPLSLLVHLAKPLPIGIGLPPLPHRAVMAALCVAGFVASVRRVVEVLSMAAIDGNPIRFVIAAVDFVRRDPAQTRSVDLSNFQGFEGTHARLRLLLRDRVRMKSVHNIETASLDQSDDIPWARS